MKTTFSLSARSMPKQASKHQSGMMLLEALLGILLFSIGILAMVGLQLNATRQAVEGKYRSDASLLATQLIGQLWSTDRQYATLDGGYSSSHIVNDECTSACHEDFNAWYNQVKLTLPGANALPPSITYTQITPGGAASSTTRVTITIYWRSPDNITHNYVALAQI
jgi:type IV pilus assembly protein PilV